MKVTAATITDEHLQQLMRDTGADISRQWPNPSAADLRFAVAAALYRNLDQTDSKGTWNTWREICATAWNDRHAKESK